MVNTERGGPQSLLVCGVKDGARVARVRTVDHIAVKEHHSAGGPAHGRVMRPSVLVDEFLVDQVERVVEVCRNLLVELL